MKSLLVLDVSGVNSLVVSEEKINPNEKLSVNNKQMLVNQSFAVRMQLCVKIYLQPWQVLFLEVFSYIYDSKCIVLS